MQCRTTLARHLHSTIQKKGKKGILFPRVRNEKRKEEWICYPNGYLRGTRRTVVQKLQPRGYLIHTQYSMRVYTRTLRIKRVCVYTQFSKMCVLHIFFSTFLRMGSGQTADAVFILKAPLLQRKIELWNCPPPNSTLRSKSGVRVSRSPIKQCNFRFPQLR